MIEPKTAVLTSGEQQAFAPVDAAFTISPAIGKMEGNLYTAPWPILLGRNVTVTARRAAETDTAVITLAAEPAWILIVGLVWVFTALFVSYELSQVWPQSVPEAAPLVSPPAATLRSGQNLRFYASANGIGTTNVTWTASQGSITQSGDFVAPAVTAPQAVDITAKWPGASGQTAKALVLVTPGTTLVLSPSVVTLPAGGAQAFSVDGAATATFAALAGAEGTLSAGAVKAAPYKAPGSIPNARVVTVTATNPGALASAHVFLKPDTESPRSAEDSARRLVSLAALSGAAGALIASVRSYVNYVGSRSFRASWGLFYIFRPWFAAGLALIVHAGYRSGVFGGGGTDSPNVMTVVFYSGLVGLFADVVLEKLRNLVDAIFSGRDQRPDPMVPAARPAATAPAETPTAPAPASKIVQVVPAAAAGKITVHGEGFMAGMKAAINGAAREVTVLSPKRLEVKLDPAVDVKGKQIELLLEEPSKAKHAVQKFTL
ncbi:MAG TPA: hypothetical protein VFL57_08710 [Bryobacteraceae bacterium]|nr:hypothetical protein [Bryobacteraceae bacterium]